MMQKNLLQELLYIFAGDFGKQFGRGGMKKSAVSEYAYSKETHISRHCTF